MNVLLVSPHLDDAVFSAGALAASLAERGHRVTVATAFTRSIHPASGFALACQLDKGLSPEVDYMALRRNEDSVATKGIGAMAVWLDLPEAPHRGYGGAAALFSEPRADDRIADALAERLAPLLAEAACVFAPQGLGGHVDHRLTIAALLAAPPRRIAWWADSPYVLRDPGARPDAALPAPLHAVALVFGEEVIARKIAAAGAYASQTTFQFGGPARVADALACRTETYLCSDPAWLEDLRP